MDDKIKFVFLNSNSIKEYNSNSKSKKPFFYAHKLFKFFNDSSHSQRQQIE